MSKSAFTTTTLAMSHWYGCNGGGGEGGGGLGGGGLGSGLGGGGGDATKAHAGWYEAPVSEKTGHQLLILPYAAETSVACVA